GLHRLGLHPDGAPRRAGAEEDQAGRSGGAGRLGRRLQPGRRRVPDGRGAMSAEAFVAATRAALTAAGLERRELDGNVYFAGRAEARPTLVLIHGANDQAG